MDEIADAIVLATPSDTVTLWSRAAEQMFGYAADEVVGAALDDLIVPPDRREEHLALRRVAVEGQPATYETVRRKRDGSHIPVQVAVSAVLDGDGAPSHLIYCMRDAAHRSHRRKADLLAARFRDLLDAAPDAIVIVDARGTITLVNAQTESVFGYPRDALLGHPVEMLMPERMRHSHHLHRRQYFAAPRTRAMGANLELYGLRRDGTEFPVEISLSPLGGEDGLLTISAIRDVTEKKALAERVRLLDAEQAARAQAEAAVKARTEFLSVAAHELKTPITSLRVFANLLVRQIDERGSVNPDRLRLALETIDQQSDKLSRLINQLLDVSRIEAGRLGLSRGPADVLALAREVAASAQAATDRHSIVVEGTATVAEVDPLRLEQVLTNLLDNAIKYSPDGGEIHVRVEMPTPDAVQIVVRDHGIGIADEARNRIFDRFYREDESSATSGMGLGLFISRQIVELHGGEIAAEHAEGGGTRFVVTLPREPLRP